MVNRTRRLQRRKTWRTYRVRNRIRRCSTRGYRLSVFRSNKNIYAQLINDNDGVTICAANSLQKGVFDGHGNTVDAAKAVGKKLGELAVEKGINEATLDRGSYQYHGRVLALADGAREAGLKL